MSIKLMAQVWEVAEVSGSELLVLLALADFANDEGGSIYPAMKTIARKARLSIDQARRIVHKLIAAGVVELVEEGGWTGNRNRPNEYRIVLGALGVLADCKGGTRVDARGGTCAHASTVLAPMQDDPSLEPPSEPPGEGKRRTPANVPSTREPAAKLVMHESPHLQAGRFVNGYIPQGSGRNAVEVYYERFSINQDEARLNTIDEDDLTRLCPDLDRLRDVVVAYSRTPFRLGNVQLILDWYRDGIPDKHKGEQRSPQTQLSDAQKSAILTRAKNAQNSIRTAQQFGGHIDPGWQQAIDTARGYALL
jgi:hypothetical protein